MSKPLLYFVSQPDLVGLLLDWGLQGVLCSQTYLYYTTFPKDVAALKIFVGALFLAEWVQTILATIAINDSSHFGYYASSGTSPLTFGVPVMSGIIAAAVQVFYAWRIFVLSVDKRFRYLAVSIVLFAFVAFIACMLSTFLSPESAVTCSPSIVHSNCTDIPSLTPR